MDFDIKPEVYQQIAEAIHSDSSPVGIDAKKTHILILHQLESINQKLDKLEKRIEKLE